MLLALTLLLACSQEPKPGDTAPPVDAETDDSDGDGLTRAEGDCDDTDATVYPGAPETCDGADQDCDGAIDEEVSGTWYTDRDGDGYGDDATATAACEGGAGLVDLPGDCDDEDGSIAPSAAETCDGRDEDCDGDVDENVQATFYADADGDGFGDASSAVLACEAPAGHVSDASDCDDRRGDAYPGAAESCDEVDNDCDGATDEGVTTTFWADVDNDGYGDADLPQEACALPTGYAALPTDCDDAATDVNPGADERCNGVDDDCDSVTDEPDAVDAILWYDDLDGDGYGESTTVYASCEGAPGAVTDGSDCDDDDASLNPDTEWYIDYDSDGYGSGAYATRACEAPSGYVRDASDCDDTLAATNPAGTETCNDRDDDCDGRVDDADSPVTGTATWYADTDGDGYGDATRTSAACDAPAGYVAGATDCDDTDATVSPAGDESWYDGVDTDCDGAEDPDVCDELPGASTVAVDTTCAGAYSTSGWSVTTEWTTDTSGFFTTGSSYNQVMMTPVVANLTDDNGDGSIDDADLPDVAFTTFTGSGYSSAGYLRVVSGDGATVHLNQASFRSGGVTYYISGAGGVAVGDLEGDGVPEIVTVTTSGAVAVFTPSSTLKWLYAAATSQYAYPQLADADGDGDLEIAVGPTILNATGTLRGTCAVGSSSYSSAWGDVDADGDLDLAVGGAVCTHTGATLWTSGRGAGYAAVAQLDSDAQLEVISVQPASTRADAHDHNGTLLWSYALSSGGGPPAVADLDGDGAMEVLVSATSYLNAIETNGSRKWRVAIDDSSSSAAGVSTFDFDGDGAAEVLHTDEHALRVLSGTSGSSLYSNTSHESGTIREMPVVADIDRDGQAEIVLASNDYNAAGWAGVRVLGETGGRWASARLTYAMHAWDPGLFDDSGICDPAGGTGTMRAQASWSAAADGAANLVVNWLGACEDCVDGEVDLYVALDNTGTVFVPEGVPVVAYAVSGSTLTEITRTTTGAPILPGERTAAIRLTVPVASIGSGGVRVAADPDDDVVECDSSDDAVSWSEAVCR